MFRLVVCLLLAASSTVAAAADPIEIKLRKREKGDFVAITFEEKTSNVMTYLGSDGVKLKSDKEELIESARYREDVLEKEPGKKATKLRRTYEKASMNVDGKGQDLPFTGKAVTIQQLKDKYVFTLDDGKALDEQGAGFLTKEFTVGKSADDSIERALLPKKPVAVGESWTLDASAVLKDVSGDAASDAFDLTKAKGSGKLANAYKKDGRQFGVMEIEFSAPLKVLGPGFKCHPGSNFTLKMVLDACIDGSIEHGSIKGELTFTGTATQTANGKTGDQTVKFEMTAVRSDTSEPLKR